MPLRQLGNPPPRLASLGSPQGVAAPSPAQALRLQPRDPPLPPYVPRTGPTLGTSGPAAAATYSIHSGLTRMVLSIPPPKHGHQVTTFTGADADYPDWKDRTKSYLNSDGRSFVGELLTWAESQTEPIGPPQYATLVVGIPALKYYTAQQVDGTIYDALKLTLKTALNRTKGKVAGEGRGLEYWRILFRDHEGDGAEVRAYKRERFSYLKEASSLEELDSRLGQWETLGNDLGITDDATRVLALRRLLPTEIREGLLR